MNDRDAVVDALASTWTTVTGNAPPLDRPDAGAVSLWEFGLSSFEFVQLLNLVETRFGIAWGLDDDMEAISSFDNLVAYLTANAATVPAGAR